ncbi:MAG: hypothetical protein WDN72_09210 [Alphaproteobacteria bacterium]
MEWEDDLWKDGWRLYDTNCEQLIRHSGQAVYTQSNYQSCEKQHITNQIIEHKVLLRQSVSDFFNTEKYQPWLLVGAFFLTVGTVMYFGYADKILRWVRGGKL